MSRNSLATHIAQQATDNGATPIPAALQAKMAAVRLSLSITEASVFTCIVDGYQELVDIPNL
jgi:hypothetical protein